MERLLIPRNDFTNEKLLQELSTTSSGTVICINSGSKDIVPTFSFDFSGFIQFLETKFRVSP